MKEYSNKNLEEPIRYTEVYQVKNDMVNNPSHYTSDPSGVECIEIVRHRNYNIGNAIKYLWRNGLKDEEGMDSKQKQLEDLRKAIFYINDEIKRLERNG